MSANGPTGISPPNSSAIAVMTHGIGSPRIAHAVAYGAVGVGDAADVGHLAVHDAVRRGVARRREVALDERRR